VSADTPIESEISMSVKSSIVGRGENQMSIYIRRPGLIEQGKGNGAEIILGGAANFEIIIFIAVVPLFWTDGNFIR
jgi:hypothetical protein